MHRDLFKRRWNKKGQVFILLALVVLLYLILLSTTIYTVTQIPYIDPSPNQQQTNRYIENTFNSLYELTDIALQSYTNGETKNTILNNFIDSIEQIEDFLESHNFIVEIILDEENFTIIETSTQTNPVYLGLESLISIKIENTETYYESTVYLKNLYYVELSTLTGSENYLYCYQLQSSLLSYISDCEITVTPSTEVINLGDGSYSLDLQEGQIIDILFPHNILLQKEV